VVAQMAHLVHTDDVELLKSLRVQPLCDNALENGAHGAPVDRHEPARSALVHALSQPRTISSNSRVKCKSWAAQGTCSTRPPWPGHSTLRGAWLNQKEVRPRAKCLHSRGGHESWRGQGRPQTPQRDLRFGGCTSTTTPQGYKRVPPHQPALHSQQPLQQLVHPYPLHHSPLSRRCLPRPCPYRGDAFCKTAARAGSEWSRARRPPREESPSVNNRPPRETHRVYTRAGNRRLDVRSDEQHLAARRRPGARAL